jgi:hypothetical protein
MNHYKRILSAAVLAFLSGSADAAPFTVEARSLGMGNAKVATANIATAPFANPGMLSFQPSREDFSLLVGAGAFLNDSDGLVDKIDDFQSAYDSGNLADSLSIAQSMLGDIIAPEAALLFSTGFSGEKWAFALSARSDAIAAATVATTNFNDPTQYDLVVEGILTTELGVSLARNFQIFGQKIAIGLTPKYFTVNNAYISESITTVDTGLGDLLNEGSTMDLGNYTTLDLGVVMGLTKHTHIGLLATNLVSNTINFTNSSGIPATLSFDTQARLGIAYRSDLLTLGADIDLIENDALLTTQNFQALKSQYVALGGELNLFNFMQLRIGAEKNIASDISEAAQENIYTAGVGFWFGFNIDLAVVSQNDSIGGFLQTGFRF